MVDAGRREPLAGGQPGVAGADDDRLVVLHGPTAYAGLQALPLAVPAAMAPRDVPAV